MRDFLPGALDKYGYINVRDTLQVDVSRVPDQDKLSERVRRNLFAIGDVANAGVIKAGHTGWNQVRCSPPSPHEELQIVKTKLPRIFTSRLALQSRTSCA